MVKTSSTACYTWQGMRAFAALLLAASAAAQNQNPPFVVPAGVDQKLDIVYARYGNRELRLDLFLPNGGTGRFPAIVYVHGGGWRGGNRSAFRRQAAYMAAKGFAGACIEYRLSGEAKWPAALHDAKAAVRWVRANAARYNINPEKIGAAGGSAGGHLVALLGVTRHRGELEGDGGSPNGDSCVQAVAAFNPALDLASFGRGKQEPGIVAVFDFLGARYEDNPGLWEMASPVTYASPDSAPMLFLHGTADRTVPYQQSVDMRDRLAAAGVPADLFTADGAAHGFFNSPPWFEPALKRMEEFFLRMLK